jgi:hypothetical protein
MVKKIRSKRVSKKSVNKRNRLTKRNRITKRNRLRGGMNQPNPLSVWETTVNEKMPDLDPKDQVKYLKLLEQLLIKIPHLKFSESHADSFFVDVKKILIKMPDKLKIPLEMDEDAENSLLFLSMIFKVLVNDSNLKDQDLIAKVTALVKAIKV